MHALLHRHPRLLCWQVDIRHGHDGILIVCRCNCSGSDISRSITACHAQAAEPQEPAEEKKYEYAADNTTRRRTGGVRALFKIVQRADSEGVQLGRGCEVERERDRIGRLASGMTVSNERNLEGNSYGNS
jgi:hypothetical protein